MKHRGRGGSHDAWSPKQSHIHLAATVARIVAATFVATIAVGAALLSLPVASSTHHAVGLRTALFTAVSASCVTGLTVTGPLTWSGFGTGVIFALIQLGGIGVMTFAALLGLLVGRLGLHQRFILQKASQTENVGDVRSVVLGIVRYSLAVEIAAAFLLTLRFTAAGSPLGASLEWGAFHAVSGFNNAGFALDPNSLSRWVGDPWVNVVIMGTIVAGGLGYPVFADLRRWGRRCSRWSLHTKSTVATTATLFVLGAVFVLALEWSNQNTIGPLKSSEKVLASVFQSITARTAGFHTISPIALRQSTWLLLVVLMFIGGGSASTTGGIKVSTLFTIIAVLWAEVRGEDDAVAFRRRIPESTTRRALTVALLAVGLTAVSSGALMVSDGLALGPASFEAVSAFATVGLSVADTSTLSLPGQVVLMVLMFLGRVGSITTGTALLLRERRTLVRHPEENLLIG